MCGISGFILNRFAKHPPDLQASLIAMAHRGPDFSDIWSDNNLGVSLGHCRLSILDLSSSGNQPMQSHCGRYIIVFNGEIYNWMSIREELESLGCLPKLQGSSDTEILLCGISTWGLQVTLEKCAGMFAIALWDKSNKALFLARDRIGEKPLHYGTIDGNFVFGSELKALTSLTNTKLALNRASVASVLRYGYVAEPYSIYDSIFKLGPGQILKVNLDGTADQPINWWSLEESIASKRGVRKIKCPETAICELSETLGNAIEEQMIADVPLGAFLSGGLDSSLVVALMCERSVRKVKTFTIGFDEDQYDEAIYAKNIASFLKTEHTEYILQPSDAVDIIPKLPLIYDEPFGDSSQIPTFLVSQITKKHVAVCLSGDAGDELFGGYNRYVWATRVWNILKFFPASMRTYLSAALTSIPASNYDKLYDVLQSSLPQRYRVNNCGDKLHKLANLFDSRSPRNLYGKLVSQYNGTLPISGAFEERDIISTHSAWNLSENFVENMMALDMLTYLPNDILTKVDRAAMAVSLETRMPFLDPRVISLAWDIDIDNKLKNGAGKWVLRQLLERYVPKTLWNRPKQGFALPIENWLRGPLREWAENLLSEESLKNDGYLEAPLIRKFWHEHLNGKNHQHALWNILSYLAWRNQWR